VAEAGVTGKKSAISPEPVISGESARSLLITSSGLITDYFACYEQRLDFVLRMAMIGACDSPASSSRSA
jgi:hypothetical protein